MYKNEAMDGGDKRPFPYRSIRLRGFHMKAARSVPMQISCCDFGLKNVIIVLPTDNLIRGCNPWGNDWI